MHQEDDLPELMNVQLLQSEISLRRAKARGAQAGQSRVTEMAVEALNASQPIATVSATPKPHASAMQVALSAVLTRHAATAKFWEQSVALPAHLEVRAAELAAMAQTLEQPGLGVPATSGRTATLALPEGAEGMLERLRRIFDIPDVPEEGISFEYLMLVRAEALSAFKIQVAIDVGLVVFFSILYMFLYKAPPVRVAKADDGETGRESVPNPYGGWSHSFWGCCEVPEICLCSCFCPAVRWSETMSYVPAMAFCCLRQHKMANFWFWLLFFLAATVSVSFLLFPIHDLLRVVMLPMLLAVFRSQLRGRFAMETGATICLKDCVLYSCCLCCTLAQDARHVEDAMKRGLDEALVGEPVALGVSLVPVPSADVWLEGKAASEKPTEA